MLLSKPLQFHAMFSTGARAFATTRTTIGPMVVRPSKGEVSRMKLDDRNLELAVRHVHQDGLVVVEDVVPHGDLDLLNAKMVQDARTLQARGENGPFNYNQGNLQQDAPPVAKYFMPSIFASKSIYLSDRRWLTRDYRPYSHSNNYCGPWPSTQVDFLLRQLSNATNSRCWCSKTACSFGRRLCASNTSFRSGHQRATGRNQA